MKRRAVLPIIQFVDRKGLGIGDAFVCMPHASQDSCEWGPEAGIVHIDFNSVFDNVKHQRTAFKIIFVGIKRSVLTFYVLWVEVLCCLTVSL